MFAIPTDITYVDESVVNTSAHTYEFHAMRNVNRATSDKARPCERQHDLAERLQDRCAEG